MEDITIRKCIEIVLKYKYFIAIFVAMCIIISSIYALLFVKPVYNAKTILMVSPISSNPVTDKQIEANRFLGLVDSLSQYPQMTLDTYKEQILAQNVLNKVIKELKLDEKHNMTLVGLANLIDIESPKNTNLIYVNVKNKDPYLAAEIANTLSSKYIDFITEKLQIQTGKSAEFITKQLELEKTNLNAATEKLTNFLAQPRGVDELRQELASKLALLTEFKTTLTRLKIDVELTNAALTKAKQTLQSTAPTLKTTKSLASDALMSQIAVESSGLPLKEIAGLKMTDEEVNPVYTSLLYNIKDYEINLAKHTAEMSSLQKEIEQRQKEIEQLQAELAQKQNQYEVLNHEVEMAKQTRDAYQQNLKEANIKQSAEIGKSSVIEVSEALPSLIPINSKRRVVMVASIASFMLSMFIVLFKEYWGNSKISSMIQELEV